MELHHKLRRDPSWHPSACNICGQLGHQAVNCSNGTINWKQIYGEEAFRLKQPIYASEYDQMAKAKQINYEDLTKRAMEYAKLKAGTAGLDYDAMTERARGMTAEVPAADVKAEQTLAAAAADGTAPAAADTASKPAAEEPMPANWATAKDSSGRTYYWHTKTKAVQWDRPTS